MNLKYAGYGLETSWTRLPDRLRVPNVGARRTGQKVVYCRFDQPASFRLKTTGFFVASVRSPTPFTLTLDDVPRTFIQGAALIVVGPGIDFSSTFTGPLEGHFLTMSSEELQAVLGPGAGAVEIPTALYAPDEPATIRPLVSTIGDCLERDDETDPFAYEALLHAVTRLLAVRIINTKRAPQLSVEQACTLRKIILDGLSGPLSVADLAQAVRLSEGHLARAFKVSFGETPHQYIGRERTELARSLISQNEMSLDAVAARAGFSSVAHMTRAFKTHVGETSRAMRASRVALHVARGAEGLVDDETV